MPQWKSTDRIQPSDGNCSCVEALYGSLWNTKHGELAVRCIFRAQFTIRIWKYSWQSDGTKDSDRRPRCFAAEGDKTCMDCGCLVDFIFSDSLETSWEHLENMEVLVATCSDSWPKIALSGCVLICHIPAGASHRRSRSAGRAMLQGSKKAPQFWTLWSKILRSQFNG